MRWLRVVAPPHLEAATAEELQPPRLPICRSFNPLRQQGPSSRFSTSSPADGSRLSAVDSTQDDSADQQFSTVCPATARGGGRQQLWLVHLSNCSGR
jgi:hypothetical protein